MTDVDFYQVLGVPPSASERSIRDAYLALVRQLHPDRVGPGGTARFQAITEAYDTLSNPTKRRRYDLLCDRVPAPRTRRAGGTGAHGWGQPEPLVSEPIPLMDEPETVRPSIESLFERVIRNFADLGRPKADRLESCDLGVILTRSEAVGGVTVPIAVPALRDCSYCGGLGGTVLPCPACNGRGRVICDEMVRIRIPAGIQDATVIEVPLDTIGVTNLFLRLHVVVRSDSPGW
jgi:DnaJ-class molecular chaperone